MKSQEKFIPEGTAHLTLPILPDGTMEPNLWQGGYTASMTVEEVQQQIPFDKGLGLGATPDLKHEMTVIDGKATCIPASGNIRQMEAEEEISFAHLSNFATAELVKIPEGTILRTCRV